MVLASSGNSDQNLAPSFVDPSGNIVISHSVVITLIVQKCCGFFNFSRSTLARYEDFLSQNAVASSMIASVAPRTIRAKWSTSRV